MSLNVVFDNFGSNSKWQFTINLIAKYNQITISTFQESLEWVSLAFGHRDFTETMRKNEL